MNNADVYVVISKNYHMIYDELAWAIDKAKRFDEKPAIYSARWTDTGLEYIDKINYLEEDEND